MTWLMLVMTWLMLVLSPSAFGQTAFTPPPYDPEVCTPGDRTTHCLRTTPPPYDTSTVEGYREWAIWYAADECKTERNDSREIHSREVYISDALFIWRFRNRRNTEDGFTLVPACGSRFVAICHTEPPFRNVEFSCAQLRLPHHEHAVSADTRGLAYYTTLPAGYSWYGERPGMWETPPTADPVGRLEVPANGSFQSGIGYVSGWVCDAERVSIVIDGGLHLPPVAREISRGDTEAICGDQDNGLILHWNWNLMGDGTYTAALVVDGKTLQENRFTVTTLGEEFVRGVERDVEVQDFPGPGENTRLRWQEPVQGFVLVPTD